MESLKKIIFHSERTLLKKFEEIVTISNTRQCDSNCMLKKQLLTENPKLKDYKIEGARVETVKKRGK